MTRVVLSWALAATLSVGCGQSVPLDHRSCPCAAGYVCCSRLDLCQPEGTSCADPERSVDAAPDAVPDAAMEAGPPVDPCFVSADRTETSPAKLGQVTGIRSMNGKLFINMIVASGEPSELSAIVKIDAFATVTTLDDRHGPATVGAVINRGLVADQNFVYYGRDTGLFSVETINDRLKAIDPEPVNGPMAVNTGTVYLLKGTGAAPGIWSVRQRDGQSSPVVTTMPAGSLLALHADDRGVYVSTQAVVDGEPDTVTGFAPGQPPAVLYRSAAAERLQVDLLSSPNHLYFSTTAGIVRVPSAGGPPLLLVKDAAVKSMALPADGFLYWIGEAGHIRRLSTTGAAGAPQDLAIDPQAGLIAVDTQHVYWVSGSSAVRRIVKCQSP
jgi:hypothetical protein